MISVRGAFTPPPKPSILLIDAETADVSSTEIRRRFAQGQPLGGRVPDSIERYARRHGLYNSAPVTAGAANHLHEDNP
jgi:nicotinic acid mononucleotide adenylyltransferase